MRGASLDVENGKHYKKVPEICSRAYFGRAVFYEELGLNSEPEARCRQPSIFGKGTKKLLNRPIKTRRSEDPINPFYSKPGVRATTIHVRK